MQFLGSKEMICLFFWPFQPLCFFAVSLLGDQLCIPDTFCTSLCKLSVFWDVAYTWPVKTPMLIEAMLVQWDPKMHPPLIPFINRKEWRLELLSLLAVERSFSPMEFAFPREIWRFFWIQQSLVATTEKKNNIKIKKGKRRDPGRVLFCAVMLSRREGVTHQPSSSSAKEDVAVGTLQLCVWDGKHRCW